MDDNALPNVNIPHLKRLAEALHAYKDPIVGIEVVELLRLVAYAQEMESVALSGDTIACVSCERLQNAEIPAEFPVEPLPPCKYCGGTTARVSERFLHANCHKHADPLHKAHEEIASEMTARFTTAFRSAVTLISLMDEWKERHLYDAAKVAASDDWWRRFNATKDAIKDIVQQTKGH